jgi:serine/threonine protein phosphatase PrpC
MIETPIPVDPIPVSSQLHADDAFVSLTVSTAEAMNPTRRNTMEDRYVIHAPGTWNAPDPDMAYLAVYDGHGGRDMVDFLEHGMAYHVAQELTDQTDDAPITTRLERAFLMADIHSKHAGITTSGATVAVCLVQRDPSTPQKLRIFTANAGDSRIVLGHEGEATRLTLDHRVDDPKEIARIQKAGGFIFKGRVMGVLAVTRSLGDHIFKTFVIAHPAVRELDLQLEIGSVKPSFLIIACDGLYDVMTDKEAVDLVRNFAGEREDAAQFLVQQALRRGTTDNVTAIVAWLE